MNVFSGGSNYEFIPIPKEKLVVTSVSKVIHEQIRVDADDEVDKSHVYLEGPLLSDEFFLRCHDPDQDSGSGNMFLEAQFAVDKNGNVNCGDITSETITEIVDKIEEQEEDIDLVDSLVNTVYDEIVWATPDASEGILVKRAVGGYKTKFNKLETRDLTVSNYGGDSHVDIRGDSILYWVPLLADGTTKPNSIYRFGHNHQEVGDLTASGGGLEFVDDGQEILIQTSQTAPTMRIRGNKNAGTNMVEIQDGSSNNLVKVDHQGVVHCDRGFDMTGTTDPTIIQFRAGKALPGIYIKGEKDVGSYYTHIKNELDEDLFRIDEAGVILSSQMDSYEEEIWYASNWISAKELDDSHAAGDNSMYIGSAKLEFNRAAYKLQHRALATSHIPKYLSDNGYTNSDLQQEIMF